MNALILCCRRWCFSWAGSTLASVILKKIILVSTFSVISIQPSDSSFWLRPRAASWSSLSSCLIVSRATMPIPARMPGFLRIPPSILRFLLNFSMNAAEPATMDPTGVHSPLLRQNITESHYWTSSAGDMLSQAQALCMRAPSMCTWIPSSLAILTRVRNCSIGYTRPQEVGFSMAKIVVLGACESFTLRMHFLSPSTGMNMLLSHSMVRVIILDSLPTLPFSQVIMCALSPRIISVPGAPAVSTAHWFPNTPVGTKLAAYLPSSWAAIFYNLMTVSSQPQVWSPNQLVKMLSRIEGVSQVTVSDRRSMYYICDSSGINFVIISTSGPLAVEVEVGNSGMQVVVAGSRVTPIMAEPSCLRYRDPAFLTPGYVVVPDPRHILRHEICPPRFADHTPRFLPIVPAIFGIEQCLRIVPSYSWVLVDAPRGLGSGYGELFRLSRDELPPCCPVLQFSSDLVCTWARVVSGLVVVSVGTHGEGDGFRASFGQYSVLNRKAVTSQGPGSSLPMKTCLLCLPKLKALDDYFRLGVSSDCTGIACLAYFYFRYLYFFYQEVSFLIRGSPTNRLLQKFLNSYSPAQIMQQVRPGTPLLLSNDFLALEKKLFFFLLSST